MKTRPTHSPILTAVVLTTSLIALSACSSSDDNPPADPSTENPPIEGTTTQLAFVLTQGPMFGSARIDRLSLTDGNIVTGSYPATESDYGVDTDGTDIYQIGRFNFDTVTRFDPLDTSIVDYQLSVLGDNTNTTNPQDLAFVDENKAYLTRRSSSSVLIIDPTPDNPESAESLVIGEIDISAYDTDFPNATDAIVVGNNLFVLMERLDDTTFTNNNVGYIAVFDTSTDNEIDTMQGENGLKGIALSVTNPTALQYNAVTNSIYVVGRGNSFGNSLVTADFYSGGIELIDPTTYAHSLLIDDGSNESNQGFFLDAEVVTAELGYLQTYQGRGDSTLRTFNPTTGELNANPVAGLENLDITTLALGPNNNLWVGIKDATPGFVLIDTMTGEVAQERVATELVPSGIVFLSVDNQ